MKDILLGLLIGGIVGLWVGVNLGKQQSPFSNPFKIDMAQPTITSPLPAQPLAKRYQAPETPEKIIQ